MKLIIQNGAFRKIPAAVKSLGSNFAIITDANLKNLGNQLLQSMRSASLKCNLLVLPSGEQTKSISFVEKISRELLKLGIKRDSCLIALGGGVIGDIVGFISSIYMRGINFVNIPTTLLAMADSSIGGKTGVDLPEGKNLLGTFWSPATIIMDPLVLKTLPSSAFCDGMAEIIKHAVIADSTLFTFLERNAHTILQRKQDTLQKIIKKSVAIKLRIVRHDEKESIKRTKGTSRMLLNYGHTVGHALEKLSNYEMRHGEAIAIGMVAENRVSVGKKLLNEKAALRIAALIKKFHLPTKIPAQYSTNAIKKELWMDKKNIGGTLYFALPTKIGKAKAVAL